MRHYTTFNMASRVEVPRVQETKPTDTSRRQRETNWLYFIQQATWPQRSVPTSPGSPASLNGARAASGPLADPIHRSNCLPVPHNQYENTLKCSLNFVNCLGK